MAVEGSEILYRVLRPEENVAEGIVAKDPEATYSAAAHVSSGTRLKTQYISTTKSLKVAMKYAKEDKLRVIKIDLSKVKNTKIIDLTNPTVAKSLLKYPRTRNMATASQEVLVQGKIPSNALTVIYKP